MKGSSKLSNDQMKNILGIILRVGLFTSAFLIVTGGILFFIQHPGEHINFSIFRGEPERLRQAHIIFIQALELKSRAIIQLGILLLIATPVARVLFSLMSFVFEKDWIYIVISSVVLIILFFSLFGNYLSI